MSKVTATIIVYLFAFLCDATEYEATKTLQTTGIEVSLSIDDMAADVEITISGPANQWFGVGFGGSTMNGRYAIIASGTDTVSDNILSKRDSCQCNSGVAGSVISVVSDTSDGVTRTVVISRPVIGPQYTFPTSAGSLAVISATEVGTTSISYHGSMRSPDTLTLSEVVAPPSMCCTNIAFQNKWKNTCPKKMSQNKCEALTAPNGNNRCAWIDCSLVGECNFDGVSTKGSQKICKKLTDVASCGTKSFCVWTYTNVMDQEMILNHHKSVIIENESKYGYLLNNAVFIGLSVLFIFGALLYCVCKGNQKKNTSSTRKAVLSYNSV